MYLLNNVFNYFTNSTNSTNPVDPKFRVDFTAFTNEQFTTRINKAEIDHGRDLDFMFPISSLGRIHALYVGSINGHYWSNNSITEHSYSKEITLTNIQISEKHKNNNPRVEVLKLIESNEFLNENWVYHIYLSDSTFMSSDQIENLKEYWKTSYGKTLVAIVNIYDINDRDDIYDMRAVIYGELNKKINTEFNGYSTHSVSVNIDCSIHSAFRAGSTFRHHGRTKDIIYITLDSNNFPCEIKNTNN